MYMTYGNALVRVASGKGGKSNEKCMGSNPHLRPLQWRAEGGAGGGGATALGILQRGGI